MCPVKKKKSKNKKSFFWTLQLCGGFAAVGSGGYEISIDCCTAGAAARFAAANAGSATFTADVGS